MKFPFTFTTVQVPTQITWVIIEDVTFASLGKLNDSTEWLKVVNFRPIHVFPIYNEIYISCNQLLVK